MTLLLDTHTLLWALLEPTALSRRARAAIENPAERLLVSPVSIYEIELKHALGKLPDVESVRANFQGAVDGLGAFQLPLTVRHAEVAGRLALTHRDPFDRLLAAQALVEGATIVTNDRMVSALGAAVLW